MLDIRDETILMLPFVISNLLSNFVATSNCGRMFLFHTARDLHIRLFCRIVPNGM